MITTFYPPYNFGGDGIFVHRLSNALARRGHRVEVIHCIDSYRLLAGQEPAGTYADHPNVNVHGLRSGLGFLSPLATQQTGFPLFTSARIREVLERGFDVIHYHNISLVGGPKILEYGRAVKFYTMHEYWLICPTHVLFRFNRAPCAKPYCSLCGLVYKRPPQWWRNSPLLHNMVKHVDAFLAPSRFVKRTHLQHGLDVPIAHLPYFAPAPDLSLPAVTGAVTKQPGQPYFLFVGRLEKLKGLQTLIPLFRHYHGAQLWIAGTGSYETQLRKMAAGSVNVRFLGRVSYGQLQDLYRQAVALIVPSICLEVFGIVIIEAFAQQTPVIVRNLGAMPEIVEESGGGLVYDTEEELLAAMEGLVLDPARRDKLGRLGYRSYQRQWTAEAHLERYLALIREIAARRR
jgi:glycosyltransferase involved in cell wall biosynthesis